jgi:N-acetylmuramoyl-L-alanine amidase
LKRSLARKAPGTQHTIWLLLLLFLGLLHQPVWSQSITPLSRVASNLDLQLSYNPILGQLMISSQTRVLLINNQSNRGLLNGTVPVALTGFEHRDGEVFVGPQGVSLLQRLLQPQVTQGVGRRISTIFLDAGHGGRDPGAIGRHTIDGELRILQEKDLVLDVTLQLERLLQSTLPGVNVVLSRRDDRFLSLEERTTMANSIVLGENEKILYISIHANAAINSRARGFEVWYLPPEFRRELIRPGDIEVISESVIPILNTILEEELTVESILLAQSISQGLDLQIGARSPNRGLFEEQWYVVRNARMPSVLVELGFLTNLEDFLLLNDPNYLNKLSQGIYNGILKFIDNFESVR